MSDSLPKHPHGGIVLRKPHWYCAFCQEDTGEMVYEFISCGSPSGIGAHKRCFRGVDKSNKP